MLQIAESGLDTCKIYSTGVTVNHETTARNWFSAIYRLHLKSFRLSKKSHKIDDQADNFVQILNKCLTVLVIFFSLKNMSLNLTERDLLQNSQCLKGVFAKNERGYRLNAIKKRFWSLLILLLSVASIRRKLLKATNTEERSVHTNSERCNIRLRP